MTCNCKELERMHGEGKCKCVHYREKFPGCQCESSSVSDYSPNVVEDDELLIRVAYSTYQIDPNTRELTPACFRNDEILKRGFSVNRKQYIREKDLRKSIELKITNDREVGKERGDFYAVFVARCGDIRRLVSEDGQRLFCVYDTASEENCSHADICQALDSPPQDTPNRRVLIKKMSTLLFDLFFGQEAMDLAAVYSIK